MFRLAATACVAIQCHQDADTAPVLRTSGVPLEPPAAGLYPGNGVGRCMCRDTARSTPSEATDYQGQSAAAAAASQRPPGRSASWTAHRGTFGAATGAGAPQTMQVCADASTARFTTSATASFTAASRGSCVHTPWKRALPSFSLNRTQWKASQSGPSRLSTCSHSSTVRRSQPR